MFIHIILNAIYICPQPATDQHSDEGCTPVTMVTEQHYTQEAAPPPQDTPLISQFKVHQSMVHIHHQVQSAGQ